ncbi:MAG: hypothetical protein ACYT04_98495, partial [Nostoc sp.]
PTYLRNRRSLVDKSNKSKRCCSHKIKLPTEGGRLRGFFLKKIRTYAKLHTVGAIHELPLPKNKGFGYCLRKS